MIMKLLFVLALVSVFAPLAVYKLSGSRGGKECMAINVISFFSIMAVGMLYVLGCSVPAFAEATAEGATSIGDGLKYIGAALSTGISGVGGGIAVSSAAIGAMSENEKIMGKTLIFVALAEGIALYGLVISIMILGR